MNFSPDSLKIIISMYIYMYLWIFTVARPEKFQRQNKEGGAYEMGSKILDNHKVHPWHMIIKIQTLNFPVCLPGSGGGPLL